MPTRSRSTAPDDKPWLARRLDLLFRSKHPAGGGEPSYAEVAEAIADAGGPSLSSNYVYMLRTGRKTSPSHAMLTGLARYFEVPLSYLVDDEDADGLSGQLELLVALRDSGAERLAVRAHGLSEGSLQVIAAMVEQLRKAEGLPDDAGSAEQR